MTTANPFPSRPPTAPASALDRSDSDVVLIVDDVPDNLSVLHDALDESGCTVLLDAMMPGMDGVEVCRQIRQNPSTASVAVIALTGRLDEEVAIAFKQAGAAACLRKPLDINALLQLLGL